MEEDGSCSQKKEKKEEENSQQIKLAAGSLLSACHDGFLRRGRALKINLKQALTHMHRVRGFVICIVCVCVLKFHPGVLLQIPLHPSPPLKTFRGPNPQS